MDKTKLNKKTKKILRCKKYSPKRKKNFVTVNEIGVEVAADIIRNYKGIYIIIKIDYFYMKAWARVTIKIKSKKSIKVYRDVKIQI